MIVCRRPCTVYDVDVVGMAALGAVALAACFGVIVPASANLTDCQALSTRIVAANAEAQQTNERLRQINAEIGRLRNAVAERTRAVPKPGALTPFLQRVASLAERCELQITQVLPQPLRKADGCLISEVGFAGQGTALDFARLLNELACENPYYALQTFSMVHAGDPHDPRCRLSWTLRLHMLEDGPSGPGEETP